jgi:sulfur relay protein TusB/DsrH
MSSTLHIVSQLHGHQLPPALLRSINNGDELLLTGSAVYAVFSDESLASHPKKNEAPLPCTALRCDVEARGLLAQWPATIPLIDHTDFVARCVKHAKSMSWA